MHRRVLCMQQFYRFRDSDRSRMNGFVRLHDVVFVLYLINVVLNSLVSFFSLVDRSLSFVTNVTIS